MRLIHARQWSGRYASKSGLDWPPLRWCLHRHPSSDECWNQELALTQGALLFIGAKTPADEENSWTRAFESC